MVHQNAWYIPSEGTGVVYAISKKALRGKNIQSVDLCEIGTTAGRPRYAVQQAWMLGPLGGALDFDCILAKIFAPASVFAAYAATANLKTDCDLFPGPEDDPVLKALLSVPWVHRPTDDGDKFFEVYDRGLPLPEYNWKPVKRYPASIAFYRRFWLVNDLGPQDKAFSRLTYFLSPEPTFHGHVDLSRLYFPKVTKMLRRYHGIVVEVDGLLKYPQSNGTAYGKGVFVAL
jgi:hypothetical protein